MLSPSNAKRRGECDGEGIQEHSDIAAALNNRHGIAVNEMES